MSPREASGSPLFAQQQRPYWFVGAAFGGKDDQTERFIRDHVWETNKDKAIEQVKSVQPGDRIAIKATYTRKNDVPFECNGNAVSVMAIKATGTVLANPGKGRLEVDWRACEPAREWYFYTYPETVWKILPGEDWEKDALIAFAFEGREQDIDAFRNQSKRFDTYGDKKRFGWIPFYMAMADRLLAYRDRREELLQGIRAIAEGKDYVTVLQDRNADGSSVPLTDICPFTTMALFNRGLKDENRVQLARELAAFLGVEEDVPESFEAVPTVNNQSTWFFAYADKRGPGDIEALWEVFARAIAYYANVRDAREEDRRAFCEAYDAAARVNGVGWNLSIGLYWIRPWLYPPLDSGTRRYLANANVPESLGDAFVQQDSCNAAGYLALTDVLQDRMATSAFPAHSLPMLVCAAGRCQPYTTQDIVKEGCFVPVSELDTMLERLREKKNLILQGPPGTGKTWLAKRLAYALTGIRDDSRIQAVQFHPSMSYEDFVRGWRPAANGQLRLTNGPFLELVQRAHEDPSHPHILVIEEINRGNPAQILGEMLTLLEADKRTPESALRLLYPAFDMERVYIPANFYVIGTMNIADRSLALVDLALRRRFAFMSLVPRIDDTWQKWVHAKSGIPQDFLAMVRQRITRMNEEIAEDRQLGPQFRIGHSYVIPDPGKKVEDPALWYREIVETEIVPLLEEYWYESRDRVAKARKYLLQGI